jgi:hypothetical protein
VEEQKSFVPEDLKYVDLRPMNSMVRVIGFIQKLKKKTRMIIKIKEEKARFTSKMIRNYITKKKSQLIVYSNNLLQKLRDESLLIMSS